MRTFFALITGVLLLMSLTACSQDESIEIVVDEQASSQPQDGQVAPPEGEQGVPPEGEQGVPPEGEQGVPPEGGQGAPSDAERPAGSAESGGGEHGRPNIDDKPENAPESDEN